MDTRFNVNIGLKSFKRYPFIAEEWILESFLREIEFYSLPKEVLDLLVIAWNSRFWETRGFDGATAVKDTTEPRLDNFIHDFLFRMGYVNNISNLIYKKLNELTGYSKTKALKRYITISIVTPYYILKHRAKGNLKKNTKEIILAYNSLI